MIFVKKKNLELTKKLFKENIDIEIREFYENKLILNNIYKKYLIGLELYLNQKKIFC